MSEQVIERIARAMEEQLKWTKLAGMAQLRSIFEQSLKSDDDRKVYELSDGERSTRDVERLTRVGRTKVAALWKKWYKMGIMEPSKKYQGKRMKRSFSLADVGIEIQLPAEGQNQQIPQEEFE